MQLADIAGPPIVLPRALVLIDSAQPILRRFGHESSVRASLAFYNNCADIDALVNVVQRLASGRASQRVNASRYESLIPAGTGAR